MCQILDVRAEELSPIIEAYRQSGVTFLMPSQEVELTDRTIIDISHESLMRVWTRLRHWVDEEAQAAGIYLRLAESADLYGRQKAGLYRDPELGIALAWHESNRPNAAWAERYRPGFDAAMAFLKASQEASVAEQQAHEAARQREPEQAKQLAEVQQLRLEQQQRSARKLRQLIAGVAAVAVFAGIACVAALVANNNANSLALVASQEAAKALKSAEKADRAQRRTAEALDQVEAEKERAENNLIKAETAERSSREFRYATDMQLAATLVADETANAGQVLARLADHDPEQNKELSGREDLRGFEWHYLNRLVQGRANVISGLEKEVIDSARGPDGVLVTLDADARLQHWNPVTRKTAAPALDLKKGRTIGAKALSRDGRRGALAVGSQVHLFDASTGEQHARSIPAQARGGLIFTPDSQMVITVDAGVGWWDAATGKPLAVQDFQLTTYGSVMHPLSVSADGMTVVVGGQGSYRGYFSVFRMNRETREITQVLDKVGNQGTKRALAISPDGKTIAVSLYFAGGIFLYDAATGKQLRFHGSAHASSISAIAFSPLGSKLVTAAMDGSIKVWDDYQQLDSTTSAALVGHAEQVNTVAFAADGKQLISTSKDKTVRLWNLDRNSSSLHRTIADTNGSRARYSPDGTLLAVSGERPLQLRDAATGQVVARLPESSSDVASDSVAFSPDGRLFAAGFGGKPGVSYIELWDIDRRERLAVLPGSTDIPGFNTTEHSGLVSALAFSPDGKHLVAGFGSLSLLGGGSRGSHPLLVYDIATRRVIRRLEEPQNSCVSIAFSQDGSRLAGACYDGTARIWDTATWHELRAVNNPDAPSERGDRRVHDVAFSPDGKLLVLASAEGHVIICSAVTGEHLQTLRGHANEVWSVAFAPHGRTLASGSMDGTIRLWNTATWRELVRLDPAVALDARSLAFSPDGTRLLAASLRGSALFWSTLPEGGESGPTPRALARWLAPGFDFQHRAAMLSENQRLHEALGQLSEQESANPVVQSALAATRASSHASQAEWKTAAEQFDRLKGLSADKPEAWLRTPGLLRMATALLHQDRPAEAARLLAGGEKRRAQDGNGTRATSLGFDHAPSEFPLRLTRVFRGSPAWRAGLREGDRISKFDDLDLTAETHTDFLKKAAAGAAIVLTVQQPGGPPRTVEVTAASHIRDDVTAQLIETLQAAVEQKLAESPQDPGLHALGAELAGQSSDYGRQVSHYTAAIDALAKLQPQPATDLERLHARRGNAFAGLNRWQDALDDFAHGITAETSDEDLLANQAFAQAEAMQAKGWAVLEPLEARSELGATLTVLPDNSILAGGPNPLDDRYHVVLTVGADIELRALRLEALTHPSLPHNGPGRHPTGNFAQWSWTVTATAPGGTDPIPVNFGDAWTDQEFKYPIEANGHLNLFGGGEGRNCTAIWGTAKPVTLPAGTKLTVVMKLKSAENESESLGRFRLSVSSDPLEIHQRSKFLATARLTDPWQKLAAAYELHGDRQTLDQLVQRNPKRARTIGDLFMAGGNKDLPRAVAIYSQGITPQWADAELLAQRARAYEELLDWKAAAADWSRVAADNPQGAKLLADFATRLAKAEQIELAASQRQRARQLLEAMLKSDPDDAPAADSLAALLLDLRESEQRAWTAWKPAELKTAGGAALTLQDGDSLLIERRMHAVLPASEDSVSAIRIETSSETAPPEAGARAFTEYQILSTSLLAQGFRAQYVRIDLPGDNAQFPRHPSEQFKIVSLAEVQVFQEDKNLAMAGKASQSSSAYAARSAASLAIDGNTSGLWAGTTISRTADADTAPWWELDLGHEMNFDRILLWNRTDEDWGNRLRHFRVRLLDAHRRILYEQFVAYAPQPSLEVAQRVQLAKAEPPANVGGSPWKLSFDSQQASQPWKRLRISVTKDVPAMPADVDAADLKWSVLEPAKLMPAPGTKIAAQADSSFVPTVADSGELELPQWPDSIKAIRFETAGASAAASAAVADFKDYRMEAAGAPRSASGALRGRYVRIDLPGDHEQVPHRVLEPTLKVKVLSLAEVQVFQGNENVALAGTARQSSDYESNTAGGATADRAVDGRTDGQYTNRSVTHSAQGRDADPWWEVDLGDEKAIDRLVIWNRTDAGIGGRLVHFRVRVLDDSRKLVFEELIDAAPNPSREIDGRSMLVEKSPATGSSKPQWALRLSKKAGIDRPQRIRISMAEALPALRAESDALDVKWTVQEPTQLTPAAGTTLAAQADGSLVVGAPDSDRLALSELPVATKAIRVETDSSPGSGRPSFTEYRIETVGRTAQPARLQGQFVRLDLPGDNSQFPRLAIDGIANVKTTNLAELQVFQGEQNIALRKKATQSSGGGEARLAPESAVDGNTVGNDQGNPYAHTSTEDNPWWEVDLGSEQAIDRLVVWNRSDANLYARMNHFRIRVMDADRSVVFEQVVDQAPSPSKEISCQSLLVAKTPAADSAAPPWSLRLGKQTGIDPGRRFRISTAAGVFSLRQEESIADARKVSVPATRLAAAYDLAGAAAPSADWFGRALEAAKTDSDRQLVHRQLQSHTQVLAELRRRRPGDVDLELTLARSQMDEGLKKLSRKQSNEALTDLQQASDIFTRLLARTPEPKWIVLKPREMTSQGGATLSLLEDGSILASGENPDEDAYTLVVDSGLQRMTALRLEALPDPSLPKSGPGRASNGNFNLNELRVSSAGAAIVLKDIAVTFDEANEFRSVIDGKVDRMMGWSVAPRPGQSSVAVIAAESATPLKAPQKLELHFSRNNWKQHGLGRFRVSATSDPDAYETARYRLKLPDSDLVALDAAIGNAYAQQNQPAAAAAAFARALERVAADDNRKPLIEQFQEQLAALTLLAEQRPNDLPLQLAAAQRLAASGKEALAQDRQDEALPQLAKARDLFSRLTAEHPESEWTVLRPTEMTSSGGAELALQADGSILASGANPQQETLTVVARLERPNLKAVRLEALPHPDLPKGGSGRDANGSFNLNEFSIAVVQANEPITQELKLLRVSNAIASYERQGVSTAAIGHAIDGSASSFWQAWPRVYERQEAIFLVECPQELATGSSVVIRLQSTGGSLGHFRLSVTSDPSAIQVARFHQELKTSGLVELETSLGNAHGRRGRAEQAAAAFAHALDLATDRGARAKVLQDASAHAGVLDTLAELRPASAAFHDALARHLQIRGDAAKAQAAAAAARSLYEQQLAAEPVNSKLATELADLILEVSFSRWTVLKPADMKSEAGALLKLLDDGSILVSGNTALKEVYTITATAGLPSLQAFRLEALPHESLPFGSSGRRPTDGDFALTEFKIAQSSAGRPESQNAIRLIQAECDYSQPHSPAMNVLDGKDDTFWDILPQIHQPHHALFRPEGAVAMPADGVLTFRLEFKHSAPGGSLALGRFRLSVTDDPAQGRQMAALKVANPWLRLGAAYQALGDAEKALAMFARSIDLAGTDQAKAAAAREAADSPSCSRNC